MAYKVSADNDVTTDNQVYMTFESSQIKIKGRYSGADVNSLTVTAAGGTLHGAWSADTALTSSDRRLKTSIEPLYNTLELQAQSHQPQAAGAAGDGGDTDGNVSDRRQDPPVNWLLRELRPVSYRLKKGPEAKYLKFGFIAQELEGVFPNLVRTKADATKAIASQDLIAVLTLALQTLQKELEDYQREMAQQRIRLERLERIVLASTQAPMQL